MGQNGAETTPSYGVGERWRRKNASRTRGAKLWRGSWGGGEEKGCSRVAAHQTQLGETLNASDSGATAALQRRSPASKTVPASS